MIEKSMHSIRMLVMQRYGRINPLREELIAYGMLGLAKALRDYDPSYGSKFSSYVEIRALGEIKDGLREIDRLRRFERAAIRQGELVVEFVSDAVLLDYAAPGCVFEEVLLRQRARLVRHAVASLPRRLRYAMTAHLDDVPNVEIARRLGVNKPRVSQMLAEARWRLSKKLVVALRRDGNVGQVFGA